MYRTIGAARRRLALGGAALAVAAMLAACSSGGDSGDGGDAGDTSAAAADPAEFCEAVVDVEAAFGMGPEVDEATPPDQAQAALEEFRAQVEPLLARAEETAPEEVAGHVETAARIARDALTTGDQAALDGPEFQEADAGIDQFVVAECGFEAIDAVGTDYEYEGIPDSVSAGVVTVTFDNQGEELHEIGLVRINDDVDLSIEELVQLPEEQAITMVQFSGAAFAAPGESDTTYLELEPGRYGAVCFVPQGTTHEHEGSGPPHFALGMLAEFTVE
jgi:hypothetical protein